LESINPVTKKDAAKTDALLNIDL